MALDPGMVAFLAYCESADLPTGLNTWADLDEATRIAWRMAADGVRMLDRSGNLPAVEHAPSQYDVRRDALNAAVALYAPMIQHPVSLREAENMHRHTRAAAVGFEQHLTRDDAPAGEEFNLTNDPHGHRRAAAARARADEETPK